MSLTTRRVEFPQTSTLVIQSITFIVCAYSTACIDATVHRASWLPSSGTRVPLLHPGHTRLKCSSTQCERTSLSQYVSLAAKIEHRIESLPLWLFGHLSWMPLPYLTRYRWILDLGKRRCESIARPVTTVVELGLKSATNLITSKQCQNANRGGIGKDSGQGLIFQWAGWHTRLTTTLKRVWFCAPSVVLAQQQHEFLRRSLPAYQSRLITGLDNAQFWSTQILWDAVLDKMEIVISTPQVLLDALSHGFVLMQQMSLLVFDEAHHCIGNEPMAVIMQRFYHPLKALNRSDGIPCVLGLTASPVTNKASLLGQLEHNMCSVCKSPTVQIDDYRQHVNLPCIERLPYHLIEPVRLGITRVLQSVVASLSVSDDPAFKYLDSKTVKSLAEEQRFNQIVKSNRTQVMKQMSSFLGHAEHIYDNIGSWAAELYIRNCATRLHEAVTRHETLLPSLADQEQHYVDTKLQLVLASSQSINQKLPEIESIAPKAQALIDYLMDVYHPGITAIIFVKRRSVAFTLTELLRLHPSMQNYQVFSFVGCSNPAFRMLVDLADMQQQNEAFADFRGGTRNICIATQVMEEGVDVQATGLVIRFDEPENFRSFVQSRGRARKQDSKFVMVCPENELDSMKKVAKWQELEETIKHESAALRRALLDRETAEEQDEEGSEFYQVASTGALLSYDNAKQHLEHFCATLPWEDVDEPARPVFIVSGGPTKLKTATVVLPASLPPILQHADSIRSWRTEKMAKKDAAFQIYRRLHTAQLVNDHLLPYRRVKTLEKVETRDSTYEVKRVIDPWIMATGRATGPRRLSLHRVSIKAPGIVFPDMVLLLPVQLDHESDFTLLSTSSGLITVQIAPLSTVFELDMESVQSINKFLFQRVLGRRLKRITLSDTMPYYVLPSVALHDTSAWFERAQTIMPLSSLDIDPTSSEATYLIGYRNEEVLYRWTPRLDNSNVTMSLSRDNTITAERLSKQLSFLASSKDKSGAGGDVLPEVRALIVGDCLVYGLEAVYAEAMLMVPSIIFMTTLTLRGQIAKQGPLSSIGYTKSDLVTKALVSSSASFEQNFEVLEFIGDSLLKYYASVQVFFDHPQLTEGGLTTKYAKIVNNARLQRVTKHLGLDAYISIEEFSGYRWTLAEDHNVPDTRQMSSKTLADAVEALIGAAFLDEGHSMTEDEVPLQALSLFFPDVAWKSPLQHIEEFHRSPNLSRAHIARLENVEGMLGYTFQHKSLLLEALTRTTLRVGLQSFERLEFLGDAILDRIVNVALHASHFSPDPAHLKYRHDCLVNRWFLAFLAMETHHVVTTNQVTTIPTSVTTGDSTISESVKTIRLIDHMRVTSDRAQQLQRQRAETTFLQSRSQIMHMLETPGEAFPWILLRSIDISKSYSDIIESVLAAVFIDSHGSLPTCEAVLESLGLMKVLSRLCIDHDMDVMQPVVKLRLAYPEIDIQKGSKRKEKRTRSSIGSSEYIATVDVENGKENNESNGDMEQRSEAEVEVEAEDMTRLSRWRNDENKATWRCRIVLHGEVVATTKSEVSYKHAEALAAVQALEKLKLK